MGVAGSGGMGGDVVRTDVEGDTEVGDVVRSAIVSRRDVVTTGDVGAPSVAAGALGL